MQKIKAAEDTNFEDRTYGKDDRVILEYDTSRDAFAWAKGKHRDKKELEVSEKFGIEAAVNDIQPVFHEAQA